MTVANYSIAMLRKPTPSLPGSPSTYSATFSNSSRLNIPFITFSRKLNPPHSLSFRFYKESPAKLVAFSSKGGNQVIEEGSSADQLLQNKPIGKFLRFKRDSDGNSGELQTAVVSYKKRLPSTRFNPSLQVDLVSTIHIAEKEYFTTLQKDLEAYDCVLFEMVTSRECLEKKGKNLMAVKRFKDSHVEFGIALFFQRLIARILMLDFQLDCLEYETENWYHADLDCETYEQLELEKGENFFASPRANVKKLAKAMNPVPELEALSKLVSGGDVKVFLAMLLASELLEDDDDETDAFIDGERNKAAMEALEMAIDEGHNRIAILYGDGHMQDLERRLREEFDMISTRVQWRTAWSIKKRVLDGSSGWPLNWSQVALLVFFVALALILLL